MKKLTDEEKAVILYKGTERPFTGKYVTHHETGHYVCKQCGATLYASTAKFNSDCGWPSFDEAIPDAVKKQLDPDGQRTEILCAHCHAHLGHLFKGEGFTPKNVRYCVNSIAMDFISKDASAKPLTIPTEIAIFAGGCFWGVEYLMQQQPGVLAVTSGYMGGTVPNPTYSVVCQQKTGHAEVVQVIFDPKKTTYETLATYFFEIHDPTQSNGQGPDLGESYRSMIFYTQPEQKKIAEQLIERLKVKGYAVVTQVKPATTFWPAEAYHQNYYQKKGGLPYCHTYTKRF
jgi:peptide methionine sulfoxide reductase msrA/msrB